MVVTMNRIKAGQMYIVDDINANFNEIATVVDNGN